MREKEEENSSWEEELTFLQAQERRRCLRPPVLAGLGRLTPPQPMLMMLRVAHHRAWGCRESSGVRQPLEWRDPNHPSNLQTLIARVWFSFKLSAVSPG